eukprot:234425-Prymnesium_polylepis.1
MHVSRLVREAPGEPHAYDSAIQVAFPAFFRPTHSRCRRDRTHTHCARAPGVSEIQNLSRPGSHVYSATSMPFGASSDLEHAVPGRLVLSARTGRWPPPPAPPGPVRVRAEAARGAPRGAPATAPAPRIPPVARQRPAPARTPALRPAVAPP